MPELSRFYGVVIMMLYGDHEPPHFHARDGELRGRYLLDGSRLDGGLPRRAERMIAEWAALHADEIRRAWSRAERNEALDKIDPLP